MGKKLHFLVKSLIVAGMILGVALVIWAIHTLFSFHALTFAPGELPRAIVSGVLAILCVCGCEYIAYTLLQMMRTLDRDPFCTGNVLALKRMGFAALAVTACGLLTIAFWPVPLAVLASLPVGMCGLFSLVLANVFARAVAFKEENDLTV